MTREEFIEVLDKKGYPYRGKGNKIVVTRNGYVDLSALKSLPPGVEFRNEADVILYSLKTLSPGVEFRNTGEVYLESLIGGWFHDWKGNIEGIKPNRLLNKMISDGIFSGKK